MATHEVDGRGVVRFLQVSEEAEIAADRGESPRFLGAIILILVAILAYAFFDAWLPR